jgi:FtsH-binding integral membrane protein
MSDYDRNVAGRGFGGTARAIAIDAGLRAYMIRVYNYMAAGVALTGVVAWLTYNAAVITHRLPAPSSSRRHRSAR